jgi:hypothetical protein
MIFFCDVRLQDSSVLLESLLVRCTTEMHACNEHSVNRRSLGALS